MTNLAKSLTREMGLLDTQTANGIVTSLEIYVHITWAWMSLPAVLVVLAAAFLVLVIILSSHRNTFVWKTSAMASMIHDLHDGGDLGLKSTLNDMADATDEIEVKLTKTEKGWLLRSAC